MNSLREIYSETVMVGVFSIAMILGLTSADFEERRPRGIYLDRWPQLSFAGLLALVGIIVWGFSSLAWYVPLLPVPVAAALAGLLRRLNVFEAAFRIAPVINAVLLVFAASLWAFQWPY
jgi:hypothetical protein